MGNSTKKNIIIMVNSFIGGTGKTSVALSNCVHNCMYSKEYENVFFIDIDRFGTSMAYALFQDGELPYYFEQYTEACYERVCNPIKVDKKGNGFYAVLLNPVANRRQDYHVSGRFWEHTDIGGTVFYKDLISFMNKCMSQSVSNLFVVDCSPGLTDLERQLLDAFYGMRQKGTVSEIEELYVTTFDASQIRKTVDCLNDNRGFLHRGNRNVSIVLNDLHNWEENSSDSHFDWRKNASDILKGLKDSECVKIRYKKFEKDQLMVSMIDSQKKMTDAIYAFVLLQEYREDFYSEKSGHED